MEKTTKNSVLEEIAMLADIRVYATVAGSTIPRIFFAEMAELFGVSNDGDAPKVLKRCLDSAGMAWNPLYDASRSASGGGGTVTLLGLEALRDAVVDLVSSESTEADALGTISVELESEIVKYITASEIYNHEGKFEPGVIDPDKLGDGFERHNKTQNLLASYLAERKCTVLSPGPTDPKFDLFWVGKNGSYVCEVKSITDENEESQLRKAIGQVLRYQSQLRANGKECIPVVVTDIEVSDQTWLSVFNENGMTLSSSPMFKGIDPLT
jgi:hypothetical protein